MAFDLIQQAYRRYMLACIKAVIGNIRILKWELLIFWEHQIKPIFWKLVLWWKPCNLWILTDLAERHLVHVGKTGKHTAPSHQDTVWVIRASNSFCCPERCKFWLLLLYQPFALNIQLKAAPAPGVQSSLSFYFHFYLSSIIRTAIFIFLLLFLEKKRKWQ